MFFPGTPNIFVPRDSVFMLLKCMCNNISIEKKENDCLFGSVKLTKNADPDKFKYSSYSIGFDSRSDFLLPDESMGKYVIYVGADMSSSVHVDNKNLNSL